MQRFSLKFRNNNIEKHYSEFKWTFNQKPAIYLLIFNLYFGLMVSLYSFIHGMPQVLFINLGLFSCISTLFYLNRKAKPYKGFQTLYIVFSTAIPGPVHIYFTTMEMQKRGACPYEWLICGCLVTLFISFIAKFRVPWFWAISSKIIFTIFMIFENLYNECGFNKNVVMVLIMIILGIGGDYNQEKNDRESFLNSFMTTEKNELFQKLIELIPDQVLIWNNSGLIFANRSAYEVFQQDEIKKLEDFLLANIDLSDFKIEASQVKKPENDKKSLFSLKINEILNVLGVSETNSNSTEILNFFTAIIKNLQQTSSIEDSENEFDLKMKKIYWDNDDAVLVILSSVNEKNLNSRLEYVNSFLSYILGNVSHDISTPFNILLGLLDTSIKEIQQKEIQKDMKIARNMGEILMSTFHTMIDIFNIRKGSIVLNIETFNISQEIKDIIFLFEEMMNKKNVEVILDENMPTLGSDRRRFRQIMIGILNYYLNNIENLTIRIYFMNFSEFFYEIVVESITDKNQNEIGINIPSSLKDMMKISSNTQIKKKKQNPKMLESLKKSLLIDYGINFSMLNYLVLCLSFGEKDSIHFDHQKMTNYICSFILKDINKPDELKLVDLLSDHKKFSVSYLKNSDFFSEEDYILNSCEDLSFSNEEKCFASTHENILANKSNTYVNSYKMMPADTNKIINSEIINSKNDHLNDFLSESPYKIKAPQISQRKKYLILNVDDNFLNLMVISKYCKNLSFEVIEAKNGMEAVKEVEALLIVKSIAFDLIFMDCDMPILDGFSASKRINEIYSEKKTFQPTIIAITANALNEEIKGKMKKSGMKELYLKPLSLDKFKEIAHKYLNI